MLFKAKIKCAQKCFLQICKLLTFNFNLQQDLKIAAFWGIPKKIGQNLAKIIIQQKFSTILAKIATFCNKSAKFQQFLTKTILRLENGGFQNGAKEIEQTPWNIMEGF